MTTKSIEGSTYRSFDSWADVLAAASQGVRLFYHAPMDYRPVAITTASAGGKARNKIKVFPPTNDADPFVADAGHLDRFWVRLQPAVQE